MRKRLFFSLMAAIFLVTIIAVSTAGSATAIAISEDNAVTVRFVSSTTATVPGISGLSSTKNTLPGMQERQIPIYATYTTVLKFPIYATNGYGAVEIRDLLNSQTSRQIGQIRWNKTISITAAANVHIPTIPRRIAHLRI